MIRKISLICLILMVLPIVCIPLMRLTNAESTEIKVLNPETGDNNFVFYSNITAVGTRFNATVWVYDTANLFAHQVYLTVDDTLLNITRAWLPTWDPDYVFYGQTSIRPTPAFYDINSNNVFEAVKVGDTLLIGTPFTGSGLLAIIEFEIIYTPETGERTTELSIDNADTYLLDSDLIEMSTAKTSGYYEIIGAPAPPIPPATLYVDPSRIVDPTLTPCKSFSVDVKIVNATNVYSLGFKLGYDPTVITVENATAGDFFPAESYSITVDNSAGVLTVSAQLSPSESPRSGNGTLVTVFFHVEEIGATSIEMFDTELRDEEGVSLSHDAESGFFSNVFMAKIYIEPEELISPELMPSYIFSVDVMIDDVENLSRYEFTLRYNTKMLTCIGIYVHPVLNQSEFTTAMQINDMEGWIWLNVTFYESATPITTYTPEPIVTLTFIVEKVGSSLLDLDATRLVDSFGALIPHESYDGYVQTLIRDVAIINVTVEPDWVYEGWLVNINVTVKNLGNVSETFDVKVYYDDNLIAVEPINNLPSGEETTIRFVWNTSGVEEGIYTIKAEATQVPDEFNIENNIFTDGTVEVRRLIQDIAVINLTAYPTAVYSGWPVNISVTVRNEGNLTETVTLVLYYNSSVLTTIEIADLVPNEERTIEYVWNTTGLPECSNYTISAEALPLPYEIDLEDNILSNCYVKIKIVGDINSDGKVDIKDIAAVASAFGSTPDHPRWNPEADINRDKVIDIKDIALVARNYGRSC